jgi:hypothetical protein
MEPNTNQPQSDTDITGQSAVNTAMPPLPVPIPAAQPAQPTAQQAAQPTSAQPGAQPTANATGQPNQPTAPTAQPQVSAAHRPGLYDRVLQGMAGGPTMVNGVEQPMSRKSLTAHILAGAITGIIQGAAKGYQTPIGPAGTRAGQIAAAAGGSFDATGQALQDIRNQPQAQANQKQAQLDAQQIQAYNAFDRNIKLQQAMLGLGNANRAALEAAEAPGKLLWQKAQDADDSTPGQKIVLDNTPQRSDDLLKKYPNLSQNNFLLVDHEDIRNPDGTPNLDSRTGLPHQMPLFVPVNPNIKLQMDDDTRAELIRNNPDLAKTLDRVPTLTPLNMGYFIEHSTNHIAVTGAQDHLTSAGKQITTVTGVPIDVSDIVSKNPLLRRNAGAISQAFGTGAGADEAIDHLSKNKLVPQNVVNALQTAFHLSDVTDDGRTVGERLADDRVTQKKAAADKAAADLKTQEAADKLKTPEGALDFKKKQLEVRALEQTAAQTDAVGHGIQVPRDFVADPRSSELGPDELQRDLAKKGVNIPSNYSALYSIAHNAADLSTLPTQLRKGVNGMTRDQGLSYIRTYINPQYQEGDYSASKKLSGELASTRTGTAGGTLLSAGTAANHLNLLEQAGQALNNNDTQAINRLANTFGIAVGKSPAVTFQAIAEQVNSEVAKVVAGGQPNEAELKQNRESLNRDQSPEQIRNVIGSYVGLMNGRIGEIDDRSMQYFGRHVKGISPAAVQVFNQHGFAAPGQTVVTDPTGKQRFFNDAASADRFKKLAGIQ